MSRQPNQPSYKTLVADELLGRIMSSDTMKQVTQQDYYQYMGQIYYLVKDEETQQLLRNDPNMKVLMPALSHLLRTTNITDKVQLLKMKIRWRRAVRLQLMVMNSPKLISQAKFDAWVNFGEAAIEDTNAGWRGRLVTERIKTYKVETSSPQRKKILGIF